ncbi:MAG: hypothetical protein IKE27_10495 [Oscillospiraceae bacterium]|nr:hypothetical protein [Oscillospiraceae bacterium]
MYFGSVYGKLGRVAVVTPFGGDGIIQDLYRYLHPDIQVSEVQVPLGSVTKEGLREMSEKVADSLTLYPKIRQVDMAHFNCTTGSLVGGPGYDRKMCDDIVRASGAKKGSTTSTAVLEALSVLGSKHISIVTPTADDINEMEKNFFEAAGYDVLSVAGYKTADPRNPMLIPLIEPEEIYHFAAAHTDPDADTLLISCCGLNIMEIIDQLENRLGIPVINSNQCTLWAIGKYFGAHGSEAKRLGTLFTK